MASDLESVPSSNSPDESSAAANWVRMGAVAVASAVAAGFAINWFYRKTLTRLRQAEPGTENPDFRITEPGDFDE